MNQNVEQIKNAREAKGWSQTVVAKKLGMGLRQYQNIEAGKFPKYKAEQMQRLDEILGTNVYATLYEKEFQPIPIKNTDLNKQIGSIEERLIRLESYTTVLFDTAVATIAQASGKQDSLIRAELLQAVAMVSAHALDGLRQKGQAS